MISFRRIALIPALCFALTAAAQRAPDVPALHPITPMPVYEVATIKPAEHPSPLGLTAMRYIEWSFGLPRTKGTVLNTPDWAAKDQYDIKGKPSEADAQAMQKMPVTDQDHMKERMGQSLLAERFHLKMHFESRAMPVYELLVAPGGSKMAVNTTSDAPASAISIAGSPQGIKLNAEHSTMQIFAMALQNVAVDRPVIDRTGLTQRYDFKMEFASDGRQFGGVVQQGAADSGQASLFTALRELGLRLQPTTAQVEVVVIDHIDPPTEN